MNANDYLQEHCGGSDAAYKTILPGYTHTEGVRALCERFKCWWLLDIVLSHQLNPVVRGEEFQVWKFIRKGHGGVAICEDGNDNEVLRQEIDYTDFEAEEVTIWLTNNVVLLPCEY